MGLVAVASVKGSPGATALSAALAAGWPGPGRPIVVEADPAGGALAARFGLRSEPSLATYVADARRDHSDDALAGSLQHLGRTEVLVAPANPAVAEWAVGAAAERLATCFAGDDGRAAFVDVGRLDPVSPAMPFALAARRLLIVTRPTFEALEPVRHRAQALAELGCRPELVLLGDAPHGPDEVSAALELAVAGVVAHDRAVADALAAGRLSARRLHRSRLWRSYQGLAAELARSEAAA
jgi:MinD-like ATPase involved in chromosome partitioning or flagellar assembly